MGIGIFPAFNPPLPDVGLQSDGKFLEKMLYTLDRLAASNRVSPLSAYMDHHEPDPEDDLFDLDEFMAGWDEWFPAADGLQTVDGLLASLSPSAVGGSDEIVADLRKQLLDLRRCLSVAAERGSRFRIEVDL